MQATNDTMSKRKADEIDGKDTKGSDTVLGVAEPARKMVRLSRNAGSSSSSMGLLPDIPQSPVTMSVMGYNYSAEHYHQKELEYSKYDDPLEDAPEQGNQLSLWTEIRQKHTLVDYSDEKRGTQTFPDIVFESSDGKILFYHKFLLMSSKLEVLKSMDLSAAVTKISMPFLFRWPFLKAMMHPYWMINLMLNAITGKTTTQWDLAIAAMRMTNKFGSNEYAWQICSGLERQLLPWPVGSLEDVYRECKIDVRQLASAFMTARGPGPNLASGFAGKPPTENFWKACETTINPRLNNVLRYFLPNFMPQNDYIGELVVMLLQCGETHIAQHRETIRWLSENHGGKISVRELMKRLAVNSIGRWPPALPGISPFRIDSEMRDD